MSSEISLVGIQSVGGNEDRALATLKVSYNGNVYDWQIYIPTNENLSDFLEQCKSKIETQIDEKESEWATLDPKTRSRFDPFMNQEIVTDIQKEEIVRPDIPDYYALRRNEYPSLGEQLGALWKGSEHPDYVDMMNKIQAVKEKYPKA
jgi:hypothetical protein